MIWNIFLLLLDTTMDLCSFKAVNLKTAKYKSSFLDLEESKKFSKVNNNIWINDDNYSVFKRASHNNEVNNISKYKDIEDQIWPMRNIKPDVMYFNLTFIYNVKYLGKIFTEFEYCLEYSTFTFFSSTSSPPIVYEFVIDEYLNINTKKIYDVKDEEQRYTGNDMITVTQKFIAFLLFDNKMLRQCIRILYRDETNFGIGHTHILLNQFRTDISIVKFLSYKESDVIYVRNIEQWSYFQINDIELVLDTYSDESDIFDYLYETFEMVITSKEDSKSELDDERYQLTQSFNLSFTGISDMNAYFIGRSTNEILKNSYGNRDFRYKISDFYMGPNLIFGFTLNSSYPYGSSIYLPTVLNPIQQNAKTFVIETEYECINSYISSFIEKEIFGNKISLYWVYKNFIDHIVFRENNQAIVFKERIDYPYSDFSDLFITTDSIKFHKYDDILVMLSNEKNEKNLNYTAYIFDIVREKIFWLNKLPFNSYSEKLREYHPIIPLNSTNLMMLVSKTENVAFVVSENEKFKDYLFLTNKKIKFSYPVFGNQIIVSHYNESNVSIYKMYKYEENSGKTTISIEKIRMHNFTQVYTEFDVDLSGTALVFIKPNIINVYKVKSVYIINYLMRLNFFKYTKEFTFISSINDIDIVYDRSESFLYIVMQNMTNPADRALFIFDFNTNSHNSLKTIVKLNAKVSMSKMAIYTEAFDNRSTKYVYIFFGGKTFQLFKFEPDNVLVPDSVFSTLFMPYDIRSLSTYSQSNVTLSIYPLVHDRIHTFRHTSLNLWIQSQNYGLMMEKRDIGREIIYIKNDASLNLSLLDYFDGYDQNYAVMIDDDFINNHHDVISDVNDDTYDTFFIDSVSTTNIVTKAILFKNNFLILFFSNNHLMQVSIYFIFIFSFTQYLMK